MYKGKISNIIIKIILYFWKGNYGDLGENGFLEF